MARKSDVEAVEIWDGMLQVGEEGEVGVKTTLLWDKPQLSHEHDTSVNENVG